MKTKTNKTAKITKKTAKPTTASTGVVQDNLYKGTVQATRVFVRDLEPVMDFSPSWR